MTMRCRACHRAIVTGHACLNLHTGPGEPPRGKHRPIQGTAPPPDELRCEAVCASPKGTYRLDGTSRHGKRCLNKSVIIRAGFKVCLLHAAVDRFVSMLVRDKDLDRLAELEGRAPYRERTS